MSTNHFRTEAEWRRWFEDAEQRAQGLIAPTPALERKSMDGGERTAADWERWCAEQTALLEKSAGQLQYTTPAPIRVIEGSATHAGELQYSKPFPLRRRRGR